MNSYIGMNTTNTTDGCDGMNATHTHAWHLAAFGRLSDLLLCWCGAEKLVLMAGEPPKEGQWITPPSVS
jgi:hypothetical protein